MNATTAHGKRGITRRTFIRTGVAGLTALSASRVLGANERVNVGIIGFGLIGRIHTQSFMEQPDVNIAGVSEVYRPRADACAALVGREIKKYPDFRKMLDDKGDRKSVV